MSAGVTGVSLHREISDYLARTGMRPINFTRGAGICDSAFANLHRSAYPREKTVNLVRRFIAAHPDGLAEPVDNRVYGAAAVERARCNGVAPARPFVPTTRERVATALVETPGDLIATIKRRWPEHWRAVLAKARAADVSPAAMLDRVIACGLETAA